VARKKKEEPQAAGCPAWLATYGDMVTLVLTFFVLLYSMSTVDVNKWRGLVMALNGSPEIFDFVDNDSALGNTGLQDPPEIPEDVFTDPTDEWAEFIEKLMEQADELNEESGSTEMKIIEVLPSDMKIIIRHDSDVFFETASAELREEYEPDIRRIVETFILEGVTDNLFSEIEVQGHADIRPFQAAGVLVDNLGLSSARAAAVCRFILDNYPQIPKALVKSAGFGDTRPVTEGEFGGLDDPNREETWRKNRRVEFVLFRNVKMDAEGNVYEEANS
jgi:chemotaxis protein MotB